METPLNSEKPRKNSSSQLTDPEHPAGFNYKNQVKELKVRFSPGEFDQSKMQVESSTKALLQEIQIRKRQYDFEEKKLKDISTAISSLNKTINEIQTSTSESQKENNKTIETLELSLNELEDDIAKELALVDRELIELQPSLSLDLI